MSLIISSISSKPTEIRIRLSEPDFNILKDFELATYEFIN